MAGEEEGQGRRKSNPTAISGICHFRLSCDFDEKPWEGCKQTNE